MADEELKPLIQDFEKAWEKIAVRTGEGDEPFNLLLIGPTGSGKTAFLNLLCNMDTLMRTGV